MSPPGEAGAQRQRLFTAQFSQISGEVSIPDLGRGCHRAQLDTARAHNGPGARASRPQHLARSLWAANSTPGCESPTAARRAALQGHCAEAPVATGRIRHRPGCQRVGAQAERPWHRGSPLVCCEAGHALPRAQVVLVGAQKLRPLAEEA